MKRHYQLVIAVVFLCSAVHAQQLGVNTDNPEARIDAVSDDSGILIPRLALTNTTVKAPVTFATNSEIVYNTNTAGDVTPGFYYWNDASNAWVRITVGAEAVDDDWYDQANPGSPPDDITDNIYTQSNVGIGETTPASNLHISSGTAGDAELIIQADTDNNNENDNPFITLKQDGTAVSAFIGLEGDAGTRSTNTLDNALIIGSETTYPPIQFITNDVARMTVSTGGNVGIGETDPDNLLTLGTDGGIQFANSEVGSVDVSNFSGGQEAVLLYDRWFYQDNEAGGDGGGTDAWVDNAGGLALYSTEHGWGGVVSSNNMDDLNAVFNSYTTPSDRRLKENIEKVSDVFPKLEQIQAYSYNKIADPDKKLEYGVMAQEIQEIYPDMVRVFDEEGHLGMHYTQLVPILVEAVKELKAENEALKTQLASEIEMIKAALNSNNITVKNASAE